MSVTNETKEIITLNCGHKVYALEADEIPGYKIIEAIGWGELGIVWKAQKVSSSQIVALKALHDELACDRKFAQRFIHEAQTMSRLHHPHIISIYDVIETETAVYYTMEYAEGGSLRQRREQQLYGDAEQTLQLLYQLAEALYTVHEANILHCGIKPNNILFTGDGQVKIADFGLVKGNFSSCMILNDPGFMAPEQLSGIDTTVASDIYSLGTIFYYMMVGTTPFSGKSKSEVISKIFRNEFTFPRRAAITPQIIGCIKRMMHLDYTKRYQDMTEVQAKVVALQKGLELGYDGPRLSCELTLRFQEREIIRYAIDTPLPLNARLLVAVLRKKERFGDFQVIEDGRVLAEGRVFLAFLDTSKAIELLLKIGTDGYYYCEFRDTAQNSLVLSFQRNDVKLSTHACRVNYP